LGFRLRGKGGREIAQVLGREPLDDAALLGEDLRRPSRVPLSRGLSVGRQGPLVEPGEDPSRLA
jgi:hypothetical protein